MRVTHVGAILSAVGVMATAPVLEALPTTSVVIENLVGGGTPAGAGLFEADGVTALSAGTSADGDGAVVELGYFTGAAEGVSFSGTWVPLIGPESANTGIPSVTIGDTGSNATGPYGFFTAQVDFDSTNPTTFMNIPTPGTRLAVVVYNGSTFESSTHFTIATNDSWQWVEPSISPFLVQANLNDTGTIWFGGPAKAGLVSDLIGAFPGTTGGARLINISARGFVGLGDAIMISGFVVDGAGTKVVLARAVGPTLGLPPFSVPGVLEDPLLRVVRQDTGLELAANDDWYSQPDAAGVESAMNEAGAFALPQASSDAALRIELPAGVGYTALASGSSGAAGVAIAEVYVIDDEGSLSSRISNLSTRAFVGTGDDVLIAGFVMGPGGPRRLLIRGVGPTLAQPPFGLGGVLANPTIRIFPSAGGPAIAMNNDWEADGDGVRMAMAATEVGAFTLAAGSGDAAMIFTATGNTGYTVHVSGVDGATGIAIVEIYAMP